MAEGDTVRAETRDDEQWPVFVALVEWSGNCTIRIIPLMDGELEGDQGEMLDLFTPLGVTGEGAGVYPIVALTVPPDLDLERIKALLREGEQRGWWDYEEGCVRGRWVDL